MAKKKSSAQCSQAGRALAECRWSAKKKQTTAKQTSAKKKKKQTKAPVRKSRRLQGKAPITVPKEKARRKKPKKKKAMKRSAASKKIENILVPGLNPKKGDMRSFLEQQRAMWL